MNDSNTINKGSLPGLKEKRYLQKKAIIGFLYRMGELSKPEICRPFRRGVLNARLALAPSTCSQATDMDSFSFTYCHFLDFVS